MPKDIRSFFQKQKPKEKPKADPRVDLSDDDVIPESPDVQIKSKKKESRKKRVLSDSSDEEIFASKKSKKDNHEKTPSAKKDTKKLQEVKAVDLFGSGKIKRTEPIVKKEKKKTETGIHSDEEFEQSLLELDGLEDKAKSPDKSASDIAKDTVKTESVNGKSPKKLPSKEPSKESHESKSEREGKKKESKKTDHVEDDSQKSDKKTKKIDDVICVDSDDGNSRDKNDKSNKKHSETMKSKETINHKSTSQKDTDKLKAKSPVREKEKQKSEKKRDFSEFIDDDKQKNGEDKNIKLEKKTGKIDDVISVDSDDEKEKSSSSHKNEFESTKSKKEKSHKFTLHKETAKPKSQVKEEKKSENKRDFSEFIADDHKESNNKVTNKKKKLDQSLNNSVLSDEERHERKRHSAILYQNYKNRSGPKNLGAKVMPEGRPDCLKDCAFLLTGVLDSFEREEIAEAIAKYGGTVKNGISKKVTHVLAGEESGPAKISKAQDLGIKILNEDDFLQMIKDRSKPKGNHDREKKSKRSDKGQSDNDKPSTSKISPPKEAKATNGDLKTEKSDKNKKITPEKMKAFEDKIKNGFYKKRESKSQEDEPSSSKHVGVKVEVKSEEITSEKTNETKKDTPLPPTNSQMWVEKYKPQSVKQIIGQHGDASNVKKLINWLTKWYVNRKEKIAKPSPWAKNDDGAFYKAALLSGPPGVGKTTTVALVCKELGFDTVEFNASDTRNKTLIREQIGELLTTTSLSGFAKGETNKKAVTKKHVLVMDEVDGMSGNEDRGGLQELIGLIKTSSVPIICMCNDRNSEKMRTLVNYCYDLKFSRPRVDQIKSAMLSVCFKEGLKIPQDVLTQLITACNQDVRQTLNSLSLWAVDHTRNDAASLSKDAAQTRKDMKLGPWEAVRKVFSAEDHKTMSVHDKSDLFFYDYSIAPLFVQENYLSVQPHCPKDEVLTRISWAADSISCGDLVEARIRGSQAWSLLPVQAMYSSVIPGTQLSGHVAGQIQFPAWLGKNSRNNKMKRLAQEIHAHTRLSTTGSKSSIYLDYSKHLRDAIITPLIKDKTDGVPRAIEVLQAYSLLREDLDSLTELALWPGQRDPMVLVDSKVKAAMTRTYNKVAAALPHATAAVSRAKSRTVNSDDGLEQEGDEGDTQGETQGDSEPENDANIKVKKKTAAKSKDSEKASTIKGEKGKKGKGKK